MVRQPLSMVFLFVATLSGMSLWFMAAAIIPDMAAEAGLTSADLAWLSSVVPAGFGFGALGFALFGLPDRTDPRVLFAGCALAIALLNLLLLIVGIGGPLAIAIRFASGVLMAGTWPVSMKIAVGWTVRRRGALMGSLVAALVAGQAVPYLLAWFGGTNWRLAISLGSAITASGGLLILLSSLGPHHARSAAFRSRSILAAWTDPRIRAAILGYLGHMWEFIAFWAWVGAFASVSYSATLGAEAAANLGKISAFLCILAAAPACLLSALVADRIGKDRVAAVALATSGSACVLTALTFGGPPWITFVLLLIWGAAVVPDSPQFSALVADFSPAELTGTLLTLQASLGFLMTAVTTQATPWIADTCGWPITIGLLALGPVFGLFFMRPVRSKSTDAGA